MDNIEIINTTDLNIEELVDVEKMLLFATNKLELSNVLFNVIIVDDKRIHEINKEYRNIDKSTDVISFALEDDGTFVKTEVRVLGDIYISIDTAKRQARDYGHTIKRELLFLTIHGLLHLLGYNHDTTLDEEKMFGLQELILNGYKNNRSIQE